MVMRLIPRVRDGLHRTSVLRWAGQTAEDAGTSGTKTTDQRKTGRVAAGKLALWPPAALTRVNPESTGSGTDDVGNVGQIHLPAATMG